MPPPSSSPVLISDDDNRGFGILPHTIHLLFQTPCGDYILIRTIVYKNNKIYLIVCFSPLAGIMPL